MSKKRMLVAPEASHPSVILRTEKTEIEVPAFDLGELKKTYDTIAFQVAQSKIVFRNYKYQWANEFYPNVIHAHQRFVDKCFPYTRYGMLFVDEPITPKQIELAKEKHEKLKDKGVKHLIVVPHMTYWQAIAYLEGDEHVLDECKAKS